MIEGKYNRLDMSTYRTFIFKRNQHIRGLISGPLVGRIKILGASVKLKLHLTWNSSSFPILKKVHRSSGMLEKFVFTSEKVIAQINSQKSWFQR